jgi:type II secretory pathway pseudopilin PulG
MKQAKNKKGFTLVELLLGMSLTILVGGVLYLLQSTGMSTVRKGTTALTLTSELRNKLERIVSDLRCTKEIIDVSQDSIKIRVYKYSKDKPDPGEDSLVTVLYEIEEVKKPGSRNKKMVLWRSENRENPIKLLSVDNIERDVFFPYYEDKDPNSPTGWSYVPFDMVSNDSGKRKKISYIRIKLALSLQADTSAMVTAVKLRPAASRIRQPNWKLR